MMQALPGSNITMLESEVNQAVAEGALLRELVALSVPATSVELVDAVPFAQAPAPPPISTGRLLDVPAISRCLLSTALVLSESVWLA